MPKILVVDDIQDAADSLLEIIALFGYEVRSAYGGLEALAEMEQELPDVVLIDLNMPIMNGYQLAGLVRERWGTEVRLIAHTAYPRSSVATAVAEAGFDAFLSKSAQPLEVAIAIQGRSGMPELRATRLDRRKSLRWGSSRRRASDGCALVGTRSAAD